MRMAQDMLMVNDFSIKSQNEDRAVTALVHNRLVLGSRSWRLGGRKAGGRGLEACGVMWYGGESKRVNRV